MTTVLETLALGILSPLRAMQRRNAWIERQLQLRISDADVQAIRTAAQETGRGGLGDFYYWYLKKLLTSRQLRRASPGKLRGVISRWDRTDYAPLHPFVQRDAGCLVAVPHHGHYIGSIIALAEELRRWRPVYVFYGTPEENPGNELFDLLHGRLWNESDNVHVIHDNRAGLATALRALHAGAVVVIMPDAYRNERDTLLIPFAGRQLNIMLGTAVLARKTGATIIPAVSVPRRGLGFETRFGPPLEMDGRDAGEPMLHDYSVMLEVFASLESDMIESILCWQYVRSHYAREAMFPALGEDEISKMKDVFFDDPRVNSAPPSPLVAV